MFPATKNGKRCYIDSTGKILLETDYIGSAFFHDERATVFVDKKFGFIDKDGNLVIKPNFENVRTFSEGLCGVRINGKWGFIDTKGGIVIEPQFYEVGKFSEGIVGVQPERLGDIMYIDKEENVIVKDNGLPNIYSFSDGLLNCRDDETGLYGYRDKNGNWHINPQYAIADPFSEGLAGIEYHEKKDEKTAFINKNNDEILPPTYLSVNTKFKEGLAVVMKKIKNDYKSGCINKDGDLVIPFEFDIIKNFSDNMAEVKITTINNKKGFINKEGKIQIKPQFDNVLFPFSNGLAMVTRGKDQLYINKIGEVVWKFN